MWPQRVSVRTCETKKDRIRIEFFFRFRRFGMNSISRHENETNLSMDSLNYITQRWRNSFSLVLVNIFFFGTFSIDEYWRIHMSHCIAFTCMCVCVCLRARARVCVCAQRKQMYPLWSVSCHCLLIVQVQGCDLTECIYPSITLYCYPRKLIGKFGKNQIIMKMMQTA